MVNIKFEAYKIKREIKRSGINFEFKRYKKNKFGEPSDELEIDLEIVGNVKGIYHEQNGSVQISTNDTTQIRTKKIPMILCLYEDAASLNLQIGDVLKFNNKAYKVTGIVNIQEWNIISDISLEVIDIGIQA